MERTKTRMNDELKPAAKLGASGMVSLRVEPHFTLQPTFPVLSALPYPVDQAKQKKTSIE